MSILRTILLAACGTCIMASAMAQDTIHFDDASGVWHVADTHPQGNIQNPNFIQTNTLRYFYSGDTVIAGNVWRRMYSEPTAVPLPEPEFQGFTRQANDLVLFLDNAGVVDTLYDFALQVGDSMHYVSPFYDTYLTVEAKDSVLIQGVQHQVFRFSSYVLTLEDLLSDTWIEGLGSIHGPLAPRMPNTLGCNYAFPDSTRLTCYAQEDVTLWQHAGYPDCVVNIALGLEEVVEDRSGHLSIWPNPVVDFVTVSGMEITDFAVFDLLGRVVLSGRAQYSADGNQAIDLSLVPPGVHVLRVNGSQSHAFRLIKL